MAYTDFVDAYRHIIATAASYLRPNRFAAWVIGEVRERGGNGACVGLVPDTIQAFRDAGMQLYNDHIILHPVGTTAMRAPRAFDATRKAGRTHEYLLIFVKGDVRQAVRWLNSQQDRPTSDLDEDVTDMQQTQQKAS